MKKLFLVAILAVLTSSVYAQLLTSTRVSRSERAHNVWVDLGAGAYTGDYENGGLGLNLGLRWNKMFNQYVGWDIIKVAAQADTKDFGSSISAEALTGIRGASPVLFGNSTAYANFAGGYLYNFDSKEGAFVWEIGAGLNVTPRFSVGVAYDSWSKNSFTTGFVNLRLGVAL
ncbi:MAG: hypothetical protein J6I31_00735 [Prevotella sp.]|nr:hypothetical protein [Prevotella sp.]